MLLEKKTKTKICQILRIRVSGDFAKMMVTRQILTSCLFELDGPKLNRGEKKCRKALMKLGMKQFPGITRVTLRKRDGYIFVINEPEVLRAADGGNSFVCFGEIKIDDPNQRLQQAEAKRFAEQNAQAQAAKLAE